MNIEQRIEKEKQGAGGRVGDRNMCREYFHGTPATPPLPANFQI